MADSERSGTGLPAGFVPGRHLIDAYGRGGFRFADMSHRGSILALPSGIRAWPVGDIGAITPGDLAAVLAEAPPVEFLIVGTGATLVRLPAAVRDVLSAAGISTDEMQTGPAARTYNILVAENRRAAAALVAVD